MPFIKNLKFKEIQTSAKNGNEQALKIIQALRKNVKQEVLDQLVDEYYGVNKNIQPEELEEEVVEENEEETVEEVEAETPEETEEETTEEVETETPEETEEETVEEVQEERPYDEFLEKEMEGLLDENEIEDLSFKDFLDRKSQDELRNRKKSDYFKTINPEGRSQFMSSKINNYKNKFNGKLNNIEKNYKDMNSALDLYLKNVDIELDDDKILDFAEAGKAYNDFINDESISGSFGRHWDQEDNDIVLNKLRNLIEMYGKQNVIAALNTLNNDNENYRNFLNNQIDTEISRYSKSVENLLK